MHASPIVPLLHRWLQRACPAVHATRATAVVTVVEALVLGAKLALTHLGRNLRSAAFAKHSIKRVDRLLGNPHVHEERSHIYRAVAHWLLAATSRPVLLIDWADCGPGSRVASHTRASCTSCASTAVARADRGRRTGRVPRRAGAASCTRTRGCWRRRCRTAQAPRDAWSSSTRSA